MFGNRKMNRGLAALLCTLLMMPAASFAEIVIDEETTEIGVNRIVKASVRAQDSDKLTEEEKLIQDTTLLMIGGMLDMNFQQGRAAQIFSGASADSMRIRQTAHTYVGENMISRALLWEGEQADGKSGYTATCMNVSLTDGTPITFETIFTDANAAAETMEAIISRDILSGMSDYIERADLLPMPRDCFAFDEYGLTVYYDDDAYRTFDGLGGSVKFYWHEIDEFIGEDSPVYGISRPQIGDADAIKNAGALFFGGHDMLALGAKLGDAMAACALTDEPDYTSVSKLFVVDDPAFRGASVEIPKYAETADEDTPISVVRHTRVNWQGLTTGETTREEIVALLGEPEQTRTYDAETAANMLLEPGESLLYTCSNYILQAHVDESGVLSCLMMRDAMPEEKLY